MFYRVKYYFMKGVGFVGSFMCGIMIKLISVS